MKFFKASDYIPLDSDVYSGGGTDSTVALQRLLDEAPACGGVHLLMDGAALITQLRLHSNTTIECPNSDCGFFAAPGSGRAMLTNADADLYSFRTRNITLLGGTYNHNSPTQPHRVGDGAEESLKKLPSLPHWNGSACNIALVFIGVENLMMRNVTLRDPSAWGILAAGWKNVNMENIRIDRPNKRDNRNQDGIHFWGPGQFLRMSNISGDAGDDFIALAPDEHDSVSPITDVLIDGVFLDRADQGIRMLSRGSGRLDRVTVRNVTGVYRSYGFYMNPWFDCGTYGNYGHIVFDNIDLRSEKANYTYTEPVLFHIGGNIECIELKNLHSHLPDDGRTLIKLGMPTAKDRPLQPDNRPRFGTFILDGFTALESESSEGTDYIKVLGPVENLMLRNAVVLPGGKRSRLMSFSLDGHVRRLILSGLYAPGCELPDTSDKTIIEEAVIQ